MTVYTLGTSNRSGKEFIDLLKANGIRAVVDVRRFPTSRFPHFKKEKLEKIVSKVGVEYFYLGDLLGGYRKPDYGTYTRTAQYKVGVAKLEKIAKKKTTAFFCAERFPWKCHRAFIAANLKDKGWEIVHLAENGRRYHCPPEPSSRSVHSASGSGQGKPSRPGFTEKEVLIIAKTYPTPSRKYLETVCTEGITKHGQLVRLYPVPYRYLAEDAKYKTYTWIKVGLRKSNKDTRKESYEIDPDSILIGDHIPSNKWQERWKHLRNAVSPDLETLGRIYRQNRTSMGLIEILPTQIYWREEKSRGWTESQKQLMMQRQLFGPDRKLLDKLLYKIKLKFRCKRNPSCTGHDLTILIWHYYEAFRNFTMRYGGELQALEKIKEEIERLYFHESYEVYAVVGTHFRYGAKVWILGELFRIPKRRQELLL